MKRTTKISTLEFQVQSCHLTTETLKLDLNFTMKLSFQAAAFVSLLLAGASAEKSGMFMANGMELEMHQFGEDIIYSEPVGFQVFSRSDREQS